MMDLPEARRILAALKSGQPLIDRHKAAQALEWALQYVCWCQCCQSTTTFCDFDETIVCPICGNGACPKAFHHLNKCAGINAHGQIPAPTGDDDDAL